MKASFAWKILRKDRESWELPCKSRCTISLSLFFFLIPTTPLTFVLCLFLCLSLILSPSVSLPLSFSDCLSPRFSPLPQFHAAHMALRKPWGRRQAVTDETFWASASGCHLAHEGLRAVVSPCSTVFTHHQPAAVCMTLELPSSVQLLRPVSVWLLWAPSLPRGFLCSRSSEYCQYRYLVKPHGSPASLSEMPRCQPSGKKSFLWDWFFSRHHGSVQLNSFKLWLT